jgi:hypothetical protein
MARMLDVLEAFLNLHGYLYMRLDGSTKPEARQVWGRGGRSSCCLSCCRLEAKTCVQRLP